MYYSHSNGKEGDNELEATGATTSGNLFEGACSPALFASGEHIKAIDEDNETNDSETTTTDKHDSTMPPTIITGSSVDAQSTRSYGSPPSYAKYFNSEDRRSSNANETLSVPMTSFPSSDGSSSTSGVSGSGSSDYCSRYVGSDEDLPNFILTTKLSQPNKPNLPAFYEQPAVVGTSPTTNARGLNLESNNYSIATDTVDSKPRYTSSDKASIAYIYPPPISSQMDGADGAVQGDKHLPKGRVDDPEVNSHNVGF